MASTESGTEASTKTSVLGERVPTAGVTIFAERPGASKDVFDQSVIFQQDSQTGRALTLYAPDLQNIGCIDNTGSGATTTYAKSVSTGFTTSLTTQFTIETRAEVSIEVVKASLSVGFSVSFTEQYSKVTTQTMTFSVPPGHKAFTYQGYIRTVVIQHDTGNRTYEYQPGTEGTFLTEVLVTSPVPVIGAATISR
ncbi:hypothetical protein [Streptomyces zagrosensis]|uniref:Uncharacterized protein n=1 Tax=Streptomyces zagrosensis TaxID=1042984 RepID=A0A7W9QIG2_9ACTN|nr:hypothetical protein [Streptomyces zagrosensis]MBB5940348.1 hypothetical protein [Streptomyces zagrosensis]